MLKKIKVGAVGAVVTGMAMASSFATSTASDYVANFTTTADQIKLDITTLIPAGLTIFAVIFGIGVVKTVFKKVSK